MPNAMSDDSPEWVLISILFSSIRLTSALAMALQRGAFDLYRRDELEGSVESNEEAVQGRITNLKREMVLGNLSGPAFEAQLDTAHGSGHVRFLLTRPGLDLMGAAMPRSALN
jgi:hypothetical protein